MHTDIVYTDKNTRRGGLFFVGQILNLRGRKRDRILVWETVLCEKSAFLSSFAIF